MQRKRMASGELEVMDMTDITDMVDGVGGAASSARLWRSRVGLAAMLSEHPQLYSSGGILDASDNDSHASTNLDTRKRKELSSGGLGAVVYSDQNKRNKHEPPEFSGASSGIPLNIAEGLSGNKHLSMQTNCVVTSPLFRQTLAEQVTSAQVLGATEVDPSFWSTDKENAGDDEYSRDDTSTFNSSEEGFCQRLQCRDPFLGVLRNRSAFIQVEKQREYSWRGGSSLLQLQLGSFILKEKLKLESEDRSCGLSTHLLSGSLCGYESMEPVTGMRDDRLLVSDSISDIRGTSSSFTEGSQVRYYDEILYSSDISSLLLSCVGNKNVVGLDFPSNKDRVSGKLISNLGIETGEQFMLTDTVQEVRCLPFSSSRIEEEVCKISSTELHQKFVLSSGRLNHVQASLEDTRISTIDRDFDDYFARLML